MTGENWSDLKLVNGAVGREMSTPDYVRALLKNGDQIKAEMCGGEWRWYINGKLVEKPAD